MKTKTAIRRIALAALASLALASTAALAEVKAKLGHAMPDTHPQAVAMIKFTELASSYTKGNVKIQAFSSGVLGSDSRSGPHDACVCARAQSQDVGVDVPGCVFATACNHRRKTVEKMLLRLFGNGNRDIPGFNAGHPRGDSLRRVDLLPGYHSPVSLN